MNVKTRLSKWVLRTLYLNKIFLPLGRIVWRKKRKKYEYKHKKNINNNFHIS
jgi:hypothetical protein